jgi:hypothetical protein
MNKTIKKKKNRSLTNCIQNRKKIKYYLHSHISPSFSCPIQHVFNKTLLVQPAKAWHSATENTAPRELGRIPALWNLYLLTYLLKPLQQGQKVKKMLLLQSKTSREFSQKIRIIQVTKKFFQKVS